MSVCVRCSAKIGFLGGYITSKGRICERCREIETLADRLAPILQKENPIATADALIAAPPMMDAAKKLVSLDPSRADWRVALCCVDLRSGSVPAEKDGAIIERSLAAVMEADPSPAHVERVLAIESGALAARFLEARGVESSDAWIALLRKLSGLGCANRAVAIAMKARGLKTAGLCRFIAETFAAAESPAVARWLEATPIPSVEIAEEFLKSVRKRDAALYAAMLAAAERKYASGAERLDMLQELGEDVRLSKAMEELRDLSPELLAALERLARQGKRCSVQNALLTLATPGPFAEKVRDFALSLDETDDLRDARAVMMKTQSWAAARDVLRARGRLTVDREQVIRAACRDAMARNDDEELERIAKAVAAFLDDDVKQAHIVLTSVVAAAMDRAPTALLSALAIDALMSAVELDAASTLARPLGIVATRRKVRKPLKDEGSVVRSLGLLRQAFVDRSRRFVDADGLPTFVLVLPGGVDVAVPSDVDRREEMLEEAATAVDASPFSERAILHDLRSRLFRTALAAIAEGDPSPDGARAMERSVVYGLLTRRLVAPADKDAETPERTGPRELCVECAARALAFRPDVPVTSENKWGDFVFALSGTLRQLGYESTGVPRIEEYWPSWRSEQKKVDPPNKILEVKEHFPPLDGVAPLRFEEYYRSPDANMYPDRDGKKTWDGTLLK